MATLCFLGPWTSPSQAAIPRVIFDSDLSSDWDDMGDFTLLHGLASLGECEIIGMGVSSANGGAALCMDAINTWYGKPDIPIAVRPDVGGIGGYPGIIASEYPHGPETSPAEFPVAATLYRQLLAASPDKSVVIVTVGYLNNLEALLKSGPDAASDLDGTNLVKRKVLLWACAGGSFPSGGEFNFGVEPAAACYVVNNWPTAVTYTPYHMGHDYMTCGRLPQLPLANPVRRVYVDIQNSYPYPSWGQTAIYQAIRGDGTLWSRVNAGRNNANPDGTNFWTPTPDPTGEDDQAYLVGHARTPARDGIDALIMLPPNDGTPSKPGEPTNVRGAVAGVGRIDLEWTDNAFNETGFVVEHRVNGIYSPIAIVSANTTQYSASGLASTANQSFRIKARNAVGDSRHGTVWIYSGWTETNFQDPAQLPLYRNDPSGNLQWALVGGSDHVAVNNDSAHGQDLTIDVDTIAMSRQGNLYVYFFHQDSDNWYRLNVGVSTSQFEKRVGGATSPVGAPAANLVGGNLSLRPWRIEVTPAGSLKFIDEGVQILDVADTLSFTNGKIGLGGVARSPVWENFRFDTTPGGVPLESPPQPPSGIVAIPGDGEVALTWRRMHTATGYQVKWSLDPLGPFADLGTVAEPAYTHTQIPNGTKHYYVISATNAVGEGQISKRAHGTPFAAGTGPGGSTIIGTPGSFGDHDNTIQKVFDGSLSTAFDAPVATGAWVGLDYGTARVFTQIQYAPRADQPARMVGGVFQGANIADFSDAVALFTVTNAPTVGCMTTQSVQNATSFRYVRYLGPEYGFCNIAEMDFATADDGGGETAVPPAITTHPTNATVRAGQTATFSVAATGTAPLSYQWTFGSSPVGADLATLTLLDIQPADAGAYTCTVGNGAGTAISDPAVLTVEDDGGGGGEQEELDSPIPWTAVIHDGGGAWGGSSSTADKAFDGDIATYYDPAQGLGGYTGIDVGAGSNATVTAIRYHARLGWAQRMIGGVFEGSDAPTNGYATLATVSSASDTDWTTLAVSGAAPRRYLRFRSAPNVWCNVAEIEFRGTSGASGSATPSPVALNHAAHLRDGAFRLGFTDQPGACFTVLASTNLALPLENWAPLGAPVESPAGQYQFDDLQATNHPQRFYRIQSP